MNRGEDLAGNPIGEPPGFLVGASFNPTAEDLDQEVEKLRRKVEAGAHAFWTQPVFEIGALENALGRIGDDGVCILLGLMPLAAPGRRSSSTTRSQAYIFPGTSARTSPPSPPKTPRNTASRSPRSCSPRRSPWSVART